MPYLVAAAAQEGGSFGLALLLGPFLKNRELWPLDLEEAVWGSAIHPFAIVELPPVSLLRPSPVGAATHVCSQLLYSAAALLLHSGSFWLPPPLQDACEAHGGCPAGEGWTG